MDQQRDRRRNGAIPPFVDKGANVSRALKRFIEKLCAVMTIQDVSEFVGLSWGTVKEIYKKRLEKDYGKIPLKHLKYLGVDEIYLGKKKKFITLVVDLKSGQIVWVGEGKGAMAIKEFWRRLKISGAKIDAVAMDMSAGYAASVREHLPHAIVTFDRFHVIKLMNERLDDLRRDLVRNAPEEIKSGIKGLRWLLLTNKENLDQDAQNSLQAALNVNLPLSTAYILKEELSMIWEQDDEQKAREVLERWCVKARASGIKQLIAMAKTLARHAGGILSYYITGLTSATVEGINRKIRTLLNCVYGLRDDEYLKLRLFSLHTSKFKFTG